MQVAPKIKRNYVNVHVMDKRIRFHSPCLEVPGTSKLVPSSLLCLLIKKREPGNEVGLRHALKVSEGLDQNHGICKSSKEC